MTHTEEQKKAWHAAKRTGKQRRIEAMIAGMKAPGRTPRTEADLKAASDAGDMKLVGEIMAIRRNDVRRATRTKGQPYSRCKVADLIPARSSIFPGSGIIVLTHPTRGTTHLLAANRENVKRWVPKALQQVILGEKV